MADCKLGMWSSRSRKNVLLATGPWIPFRILYCRWKRVKFPEGKSFELEPPKSLRYFALRRSRSGRQGLGRVGSLEPESNPSKVFRIPHPCFVCKSCLTMHGLRYISVHGVGLGEELKGSFIR